MPNWIIASAMLSTSMGYDKQHLYWRLNEDFNNMYNAIIYYKSLFFF